MRLVEAFVVASRTLTVAPGTTAPLLSRTVPRIDPVSTWAWAGDAARPVARRVKTTRGARFITDLQHNQTQLNTSKRNLIWTRHGCQAGTP